MKNKIYMLTTVVMCILLFIITLVCVDIQNQLPIDMIMNYSVIKDLNFSYTE